jgi:hypothetical protein
MSPPSQSGHQDLDAKLFNTAEYKAEAQKIVESLPSLLLETSIENEKCWLLEIPGSNGQMGESYIR